MFFVKSLYIHSFSHISLHMAAADFSVPPNVSLEEKVDLILFFLAGTAKKQEQVDALEVKVNMS